VIGFAVFVFVSSTRRESSLMALRMPRSNSARNASWKNHLGNWRAFAAACGASMAAATNADAGIVYSGVLNSPSVSPAGPTTGLIYINGNALNVAAAKFGSYFRAGLNNPAIAGVVAIADTGAYVKKYGMGQAIKATNTNNYGGVLRRGTAGPWGPGNVTSFAGFRTLGGDLGWLELSVQNDPNGIPTEVTVISYAYNETPGGAINAGQTSAVPEPSSMVLALLGAGAVGLMALRRAKAAHHGEAAVAQA
jgi:hypothetical protein